MPETTNLVLPLLPLTTGVVLPGMVVTLTIESDDARAAVDAASTTEEKLLLLVPRIDGRYARVGTIAAIVIAPVAAMLLQFAVSRQREFLADATAAELLGTGRPLADALGTLQRGVEVLPMNVNPASASLYIVNPLAGGGMATLFSTHPPIGARIERLLALDARRGL